MFLNNFVIYCFSSIDCSKRKKRRDEGVFIHFLEESFVGKKEEAGGGKKALPPYISLVHAS